VIKRGNLETRNHFAEMRSFELHVSFYKNCQGGKKEPCDHFRGPCIGFNKGYHLKTRNHDAEMQSFEL